MNQPVPFTCAECKQLSCRKEGHPNMPANCPMRTNPEIIEEARREYLTEENNRFFIQSAYLESDAFGRFPRLKETILFCKRMGYQHIGLAFCSAFAEEACIVSKLLREAGMKVESVRCKCGGIRKDTMNIERNHWVHPELEFEPICNPITQAKMLDNRGVEFNIIMGLCVGHDSLFIKYTNTLSTVLLVKDRVCGHNPIAAVYLYKHNYWGSMISEDEEKNES